MYNAKTFAANIRRLRGERNMTISELANKVGVSVSCISKYENPDGCGKLIKRSPYIDIVMAIAEALDVGVDELVYGRY